MAKITQRLCKSIGGHCWMKRKCNYSLTYPNGEPRFRECKHCGRKEDLTKVFGIKGNPKSNKNIGFKGNQ